MKSDDQLKKEEPMLYKVAREGGTEAPFKGKYVDEKSDGMYHCAVCGVPLFSSDTKFDSDSGWPSFTDPAVADAVVLHEDVSLGMTRTEVICKNCGAHLGHVFPDGPKKEGKVCDRYCINSVSLELKKKEV
jgi:peptide-methionine (R)-S-oxide reductase